MSEEFVFISPQKKLEVFISLFWEKSKWVT